eukprot:gene14-9660_t
MPEQVEAMTAATPDAPGAETPPGAVAVPAPPAIPPAGGAPLHAVRVSAPDRPREL